MAATVQFNVRIDGDLKKSGDVALALIGLTPTQAVRALWEKAARRGKDLEQVAELLSPPAKQGMTADARHDDVKKGWDFMDKAYASLGTDPSVIRDYPEDELLESALEERFSERGLA